MPRVPLSRAMERVRRPIETEPGAVYHQIGIRSFGKGWFVKPGATGSEIGNKKLFEIAGSDLVFNIVFAWECAVALAGTQQAGKCGSHRFPTYRAVNGVALPEYLLAYFQSSAGTNLLAACSPGSAGRNRTLNQGQLLETEIDLPSVDEQRRVVDLLGAAHSAVQAATRQEQAAAALRDVLVDEHVLAVSGESCVLSDVAIINPREPALPEDAPFAPMDAVPLVGTSAIRYTEPRGSRAGAKFRSGDVLLARITPSLENGKVALVQPEIERGGGSTELIVMRAKSGLAPQFLYYWASSISVREAATVLMTGTTGRQRLSPKDLAQIPMTVPDAAAQQEVLRIGQSLDAALAAARGQRDQAVTVEDALREDLLVQGVAIGPEYDRLLAAS